jgi:hypothetical protein
LLEKYDNLASENHDEFVKLFKQDKNAGSTRDDPAFSDPNLKISSLDPNFKQTNMLNNNRFWRPELKNVYHDINKMRYFQTPTHERLEDKEMMLFNYVPQGSGESNFQAERGDNPLHNDNERRNRIRYRNADPTVPIKYEPVGTHLKFEPLGVNERPRKRVRQNISDSLLLDQRNMEPQQLLNRNVIFPPGNKIVLSEEQNTKRQILRDEQFKTPIERIANRMSKGQQISKIRDLYLRRK